LTEEYKSTIEELRKFAIRSARVQRLEHELQERLNRLQELEEEIQESKVDLAKLADKSFMNIYLKLTNQMDDHFKIQEQYYLDISLEFNDILESLPALKKEIQQYKNQNLEFEDFKDGLVKKMHKFRNAVRDTRIEEYVKITEELENCFQLKVELIEATTLGFDMIEGLSSAIDYIRDASFQWKGESGPSFHPNSKIERQRFREFKQNEFKKYQSIILPLRHNFIKFIGEVNDVYVLLLKKKKLPKKVINKFTDNYLRSIATDMRKAKNFSSSIRFLNQYKDRVEVLTYLMRDDLEILDKDIAALEAKEAKIIESLLN